MKMKREIKIERKCFHETQYFSLQNATKNPDCNNKTIKFNNIYLHINIIIYIYIEKQ